MKKSYTPEISFTCKAWNGRVVCEWLASTLRDATANYDEDFDHGCLALACTASILKLKIVRVGRVNYVLKVHLGSNYFLKPLSTTHQASPPHMTAFRTALVKWFRLQESNPRHLCLDCINVLLHYPPYSPEIVSIPRSKSKDGFF